MHGNGIGVVAGHVVVAVSDEVAAVNVVGEVRAVSQAERRVTEAIKTGYTVCVLPESNRVSIEKAGNLDTQKIKLIGIRHVRELLDCAGL